MFAKLQMILPRLRDDDYKTVIQEIVRHIINKNTEQEIKESLDRYYFSLIEPLNYIKDEKVGDTNEYTDEQLKELVKKDYEAFENIKNRDFVRNAPKNIKDKFDEFIDNVFDYENVMMGICLQKTKKFEEQINR